MQKFLVAILTIVSVALSVTLGVVLQEPEVSIIEIDRDRAALSSRISTTQEESEKYGQGLLRSPIEVRLAIARNTLAMLDKKRASFVRRITLDYRLDGQRQPYRQTIAIDHRVDFIRQSRRVTFPSIGTDPDDAASMLMHADNRGVDHLDSGILGSSKCVYDAASDISAPPTDEAVVACGGRNQISRADHAKVLQSARPRRCHEDTTVVNPCPQFRSLMTGG